MPYTSDHDFEQGLLSTQQDSRHAVFSPNNKILKILNLLLKSVFILCAVAAFSFLLLHDTTNQLLPTLLVSPGNSQLPCLTPDCVRLSARILEMIDSEIDPCDDYYAYACGGWDNSTNLPDDRPIISDSFAPLEIESKMRYRAALTKLGAISAITPISAISTSLNISDTIVASNTSNVNFDEFDNILGHFWLKCLDESKLSTQYPSTNYTIKGERHESTHHLDIEIKNGGGGHSVDQIIGASSHLSIIQLYEQLFPVSDPIWKRVALLTKLGGNAMLTLSVSPKEDSNEGELALHAAQGGLGMPQPFWSIESKKSVFRKYLNNLAIASEIQDPSAVENAMAVHQWLAEVSLSPLQQRNPLKIFNPTTVGQTGLTLFIENVMQPIVPANLSSMWISVENEQWIQKVSKISNNFSNKRLSDYLLFRFLDLVAPYLSTPWRHARMDLDGDLTGTTTPPQRWEQCVGLSTAVAGWAVSRRATPRDAAFKKQITEIVTSLQRVFSDRIAANEWMDSTTREKAMNKINAMHHHVAYPSWMIDDGTSLGMMKKIYGRYYTNVNLLEIPFLSLSLSMIQSYNDYQFSLIGKTMENLNSTDKLWLMFPNDVNAYYNPQMNEMVVPMGILAKPFVFKITSDLTPTIIQDAVNLGSIGSVIGHEMTHGFDDQGAHFGPTGALQDWWDKETIAEFKTRSKCMVDQYSDYSVSINNTDVHLIGKLELGENLADNGGLKVARQALDAKQNGGQSNGIGLLPGLPDVTIEKLFYLSFAQTWCTKSTDEYLLQQISSDPHAPGNFRVLGSLKNNVEFSKTYNCPVGSKMNPKNKCDIW